MGSSLRCFNWRFKDKQSSFVQNKYQWSKWRQYNDMRTVVTVSRVSWGCFIIWFCSFLKRSNVTSWSSCVNLIRPAFFMKTNKLSTHIQKTHTPTNQPTNKQKHANQMISNAGMKSLWDHWYRRIFWGFTQCSSLSHSIKALPSHCDVTAASLISLYVTAFLTIDLLGTVA